MDENNLNKYSEKLFENFKLEKVPANFTDKLMVRIEQEKLTEIKKNSIFSKKFLLAFTLTFLSIFAIGFLFQGKTSEGGTTANVIEKVKLPDYHFGKILELLNFNFEISLFVKLIILSVIALVIIDLLTGSILDYFIDSKAKKGNT